MKIKYCKDCKYCYDYEYCILTAKENTDIFYNNPLIIKKCKNINIDGFCKNYKKKINKKKLYLYAFKEKYKYRYCHCKYCKNGTINHKKWICYFPIKEDYVNGGYKYKRVSRKDYNKNGNCQGFESGYNNFKDSEPRIMF